MSDENIEVVRGAYENFNSGDIPAVAEVLDAEVEWTEPGGGSAPAGTFKGPDSVVGDVFSKVGDNFEEFQVVTDEYKDDGDAVIASGRFVGKSKAGIELDTPFTHTYELSDGKVTKFQNETDTEAWGAAWGA